MNANRERLYARERNSVIRGDLFGECPHIEDRESHNRAKITEEEPTPGDPPTGNEFVRHHPIVSYLFGDMIRGFYVVGCLGLDLFVPVQVHLWFPGQDVLVLPPVVAAILALAYGEWRLYRRLWPRTKLPGVVDMRDLQRHR